MYWFTYVDSFCIFCFVICCSENSKRQLGWYCWLKSNDTLMSTSYKQRTHDTLKPSYYIQRTSHSIPFNLIIVYRDNLIRDTWVSQDLSLWCWMYRSSAGYPTQKTSGNNSWENHAVSLISWVNFLPLIFVVTIVICFRKKN